VADWEIGHRVLQIWAICPAVAPGRFAEQLAALLSCVAPRRRITAIR
jgi:hypothetical protein